MDKVSAALLLGIILLMIASGVMVYDTRAAGQEAERALTHEVLIFHDDTSITSNSFNKLWLRVQIVYAEGYAEEGFEIVSSAVEEGIWIPHEDGWYYYDGTVSFAQSTRPLIDELRYQGVPAATDSGSFRLTVEAIDETWLPVIPEDGMEAFKLFTKAKRPSEIVYL